MATHSVTTVALLDDEEIYRVARSNNKVDVRSVTKSEAVFELSEGIATIDTGLRIASSAAPITILTEGNNALHLKKWASLFFPGKIEIFDDLQDKSSDSQLKAYGELLSKMRTNSHYLIVWDCDAESTARKFSKELPDTANVTAFSFSKRENRIAPKGIENQYDGEILKPFAVRSAEYSTDREISLLFDKGKKTDFAKHIVANGTKEDFRHFDALKSVVSEILKRQANQKRISPLAQDAPTDG